jgi:alpha-L-rhamnosidase
MVANGSQTSLSCALYQDLLDSETRPKTLALLVEAVKKNNGHIDTGILGSKYLLNALSQMGRSDVAYTVASQETQPGWGWWIKQGATTMWEQWNGNDSRNHIMFGDINAWFVKILAGINPDPAAPGFKRFTVKPYIPVGLESASGRYESARGLIHSSWGRSGYNLQVAVSVPPNTRASIFVPAVNSDSVKELDFGGPNARLLRFEEGYAVFEAGSGTYAFISERYFSIKQAKR